MSEQPAPYETRTPKVDILKKLLGVFTEEQLVVVTDMLIRIHTRAIARKCDQSVTIVFDFKGYPRYCNGTDGMPMPKPKIYSVE